RAGHGSPGNREQLAREGRSGGPANRRDPAGAQSGAPARVGCARTYAPSAAAPRGAGAGERAGGRGPGPGDGPGRPGAGPRESDAGLATAERAAAQVVLGVLEMKGLIFSG